LVIPLILLLCTLVSCNNTSPKFPDDFNLQSEITSEIGSSHINFYIQATPSMAGFVAGGGDRSASVYAKILSSLEAPLTLWSRDKREVSHYRFDISGMDIETDWPFYRISDIEFQRDTLAEMFYSLDWVLNSAIYGRLFENVFGENTDIGIFREPFIANTVHGLQSDHLSIIVTDLLDFNLGTGLVSALTEKINAGSSLAIIALESLYMGQHQIPGTTMRASSEEYRPFYLLITGPHEYVSMYSSHLIDRMNTQGIDNDPLYIIQGTPDVVLNFGLSEVGEAVGMERIASSDLREIIGDADPQNVFMYHLMRGRNNASVSFNLPLFMDLDMVINSENTSRVSIGGRHSETNSNAFNRGYFISNFLLERLDRSEDEELHNENIGTYNIISERETETFLRLETRESGFTFTDRNGDASLVLVIDSDNLRRTYGSLSRRYRLTVELSYLLETLTKPEWVARHNGSINDLSMSKTPNLNAMITDIINAAERNREKSRIVSITRLHFILR
jgi:hypothetical protein